VRPLRLTPSAALRERRLTALLETGKLSRAELDELVSDAQALGSLELAGFRFGWQELRAARRGEPAAEEITRLQRAQDAVAPGAPLDLTALRRWHAAVVGRDAGLRTRETERRDGPPPAPPEFIETRLRSLEDWLAAQSARELAPAQAAALALARVVEILPFDEGNGRVARLAASHAAVRAGGRPPILAGGDQPRLDASLQAAFRLDTEPLTLLLEEACERPLQVMLQALEGQS
jgi:hypothetical protein